MKRLICGLLTAAALTGCVSAAGIGTYIYDKNDRAVPAPAPAEFVFSLRGDDLGAGSFADPQDLIITPGGELYIADTKNNRIVILPAVSDRPDTESVRVIDRFDNNGARDTFNQPKGLFVDESGEVWIADTENSRIVRLDANGALLQIIGAPESDALPDGFEFKPAKLEIDLYRQLFVISEGYNDGLMKFESSGHYIQSMGAPRVAFSLAEQFWRRFSTKTQRDRTQNFVPTEYSNLSIDDEGFIFATTAAYDAAQYASGQIKPLRKLNAKGSDVLKRVGDPVGDDIRGGSTYKGPSSFVDVCQLGYGDFALLDRKRGRIFAYNSEGEMLYQFGGPGAFEDEMSAACALAFYKGCFYVLDAEKQQISVFSLTDYGSLFGGIAKARLEIDYETEERLWNQVIARNENCVMALRGLGNAAYKRKDMAEAMRYFKLAGDRENYSKAYTFVRRDWIESNVWILAAVVAGIILLVFAAIRVKPKIQAAAGGSPYLRSLGFAGRLCLHPMKGFWELKRERRGSLAGALTLLGICLCGITASSLGTGFIFNFTDIETYSIFSLLYILAGVVLWVVSQWCVTSLMYGAGNLRDIFIATCYSTVPYTVISCAALVVSQGLLSSEGDLYYVMLTVAAAWLIAMLAVSVAQTHDFSGTKTLLAILITLVVILLIVFIAMLVFALSQQLYAFVRDLIDEISLRV